MAVAPANSATQAMPCTRWPSSQTLSTWCGPSHTRSSTYADLGQLNDVFSLLVGLWAVRVANQKAESKMYTYGVSRVRFQHHQPTLTMPSGNEPKP